MFGSLPQPAYLPCPECGASLALGELAEHACDEAQRIRYELFQIRCETERFDDELAAWLRTKHGRFEVFYAARARKRP
jgi:hypothetical protein